MMGEPVGRQDRLFYAFDLEDMVPADHAILEIYRHGVINVQRIPDVLNQVAENPGVTRKLHNVIDGVCETI